QEFQSDLFRRDEQFRKSYGSKATDPAQKSMVEQFRKIMINPDRVLDEIVQQKVFFHLFDEQSMQVSKAAIRSQIEQLPYFQRACEYQLLLPLELSNVVVSQVQPHLLHHALDR
ncbi:MAG: hypothetical protein RIR15_282, partial [Actinomycetota bacterium]